MGITCSWLSKNFEPIETLLNLFYVPHPHTNLTIKNLLVEEISKWDLEGKIIAITTDNGSNMVSGSRLLKVLKEFHVQLTHYNFALKKHLTVMIISRR